jgi:hypothetical protein
MNTDVKTLFVVESTMAALAHRGDGFVAMNFTNIVCCISVFIHHYMNMLGYSYYELWRVDLLLNIMCP